LIVGLVNIAKYKYYGKHYEPENVENINTHDYIGLEVRELSFIRSKVIRKSGEVITFPVEIIIGKLMIINGL